MNILLIGKFYPEGFAQHILETLEKMGNSVSTFEVGGKYSNSKSSALKFYNTAKNIFYNYSLQSSFFQKRQAHHILTHINKKVDLSIVCHDFLSPAQVKILKDFTKSPIALWFPDSISNFRKAMFLVSDYDYLFFKDPFIVSVLRANYNFKNVYYLPECCNPAYHKHVSLTEEDENFYKCDITTAGNMHASRIAFFKQLKNYNVKLWGNAPPLWIKDEIISKMFMNKFVANEEKAKAFTGAKIVLNNLHPSEIWGINARAFEIPACGGFELINWLPGLQQLFEDGKELVSFINFEDLKEKIEFYLTHDKERKEIAVRGNLRAHKDHTYENRLELLLDTVFGYKKGFEMPHIEFKL